MSLSEFLLTSPAARLIGWTLVHFVWEGILLAALLALLLEWAREKSPELRYAMALVSLFLISTIPLITAVATHQWQPASSGSASAISLLPSVKTPASLTHASSPDAAIILAVFRDASHQMRALLEGRNTVREAVQSSLPIVVSLWLAGVLLFSMRFVRALLAVRNLLRTATTPALSRCEETVRRLHKRFNMTLPVKLMQSAMVQVPTVAGAIRPVILLPLSAITGLPQDELEMVIAHELAHIKRHDFLVNVIQNLLETLFFFHPAVWWISGRLRVERELCCDDMAVMACGDRLRYARALADLEELRSHPQPALAANGGDLLYRIRRILGVEVSPRDSASFLVAGSVISFLGLIAIAPLAVMAMPTPPAAPSPPKAISERVPVPPPASPVSPSTVISVEARRDLSDLAVPLDVFVTEAIGENALAISIPAVPAAPAIAPLPPRAPPIMPRLLIRVPVIAAMPAGEAAFLAAPRPLLSPAVVQALERVKATAPLIARMAILPRVFSLPAVAVPGVASVAEDGSGRRHEAGRSNDPAVSAEFMREMREAGYQLSAEDAEAMISLRVTRAFVDRMKGSGLSDLSAGNLISLKAVGVTPDFISGMRSVGLDELSTGNVIALRSTGVNVALVQAMHAAGFTDLSAENVLSAKAVGVTAAYMESMKASHVDDLGIDEIIAFRSLGITESVVAQYRSAGFHGDAGELIALRSVGVPPDDVRRFAQLGYDSLSAEDLIGLKNSGVTPEFVEELKRQGRADLSVDELIEARSSGRRPHRR
ncbi:MAG: M56 family metallopeptidase [Acidobacteriota bacterium]